jgi:hypothetical protein
MTIYRLNLYVCNHGMYQNFWSKEPTKEQIIERLREENATEVEEDKEPAKRFIETRVKLIQEGSYHVVKEELKEI